MPTQYGVTITTGPADWQILQQDSRGLAQIALSGTWRSNDGAPGVVEVRLAFEDTSASVTQSLHWREAPTCIVVVSRARFQVPVNQQAH